MRTTLIASSLLCLGLLAGCANLAPDYSRPALPVPTTVDGRSIATHLDSPLVWQALIGDARLQAVIEQALTNNRDLRIAALNVDKARAQYRIQDAALYPTLNATTGSTAARSNGNLSREVSAKVGVTSYELDFFGRIGNLKDAALQSFLATEESRRSVQLSLVAEVANAWLTLAADQSLLKLAQDTWDSRSKTLELTRKQQALGGASGLAVAQAQASSETARADVASYISQVAQDRNALSLLVGSTVSAELLPPVAESVSGNTAVLVDVPEGLSSEVLQRRPDVLAAEHTLQSAYADIGAARAAFFPKITLTAAAGTASSSLSSLFGAGSGAWSFAPSITLPIFDAGNLQASLAVARITRDIQLATYEKTLQTAFKEVADALAERSTLNERMAAQRALVSANSTSLRLSSERYRSGADSYLSVLDAQRSLYSAQKSLISLKLAEQSNRITLFKVLGGE